MKLLMILLALLVLFVVVALAEKGPEEFALLAGPKLHPTVLVFWNMSPGVTAATSGLLFGSNAEGITLYQSEDVTYGTPLGFATKIRWSQVQAAWFMERGTPLEGDR